MEKRTRLRDVLDNSFISFVLLSNYTHIRFHRKDGVIVFVCKYVRAMCVRARACVCTSAKGNKSEHYKV